MQPITQLTDSDLDNLHRLYARTDVVRRRRRVRLGERRVAVIERRATACREAGRWLACLWLLVVGVAALQERREGAR